MSKMSQLHAELTEQAYELGFDSISEAEEAGYGVDWENEKLLAPEEAAHKALLADKESVLTRLGLVTTRSNCDKQTIEMAMKMVREEIK